MALGSSNKLLQLYAAGTLANLAKYPRASSLVRRYGGLPKLVALLKIDTDKFSHEGTVEDDELPLELQVARGSAFALWSLSKSERNKVIIRKSNGLELLSSLSRSEKRKIQLRPICKRNSKIDNLAILNFLVHF